jgi:hypothetical protein
MWGPGARDRVWRTRGKMRCRSWRIMAPAAAAAAEAEGGVGGTAADGIGYFPGFSFF